jgi:hypothetical protein
MKMSTLLENSWMLCQPKSVGASHPDEGVFHFGWWQILGMSRIAEFILDNIADYLQLSPMHNHCCRATSHHHGIINSAAIFTPRPLRHPVLMTMMDACPNRWGNCAALIKFGDC